MIGLLFAMVQIVVTGPPPPGPPAAEAKHYIFSGYDYPAEAVKNEWEGTVAVDVVVGADGWPKSCSIVISSGHQLLDDTTCGLIMKRAKFIPIKAKDGKPVESHFRPPSVTWRLQK